MSGYALLSEVYSDEDLKPKKRGKRRKEKKAVPIPPLSPQEMDKELLEDVDHMRASPYDQQERHYQRVQPIDHILENENIMEPYSRPIRSLGPHTLSQDADYQEFLEFKKRRRDQSEQANQVIKDKLPSPVSTLTSSSDQFNELLLYMFTGFFLLIVYDNIYKLGRDSY